jgi:hypothetical protein
LLAALLAHLQLIAANADRCRCSSHCQTHQLASLPTGAQLSKRCTYRKPQHMLNGQHMLLWEHTTRIRMLAIEHGQIEGLRRNGNRDIQWNEHTQMA